MKLSIAKEIQIMNIKRMHSENIKNIYLGPTNEEAINPQDYLKLTEKDKLDIESVRIIPPTLGKNGFGKMLIKYKFPIYRGLRHA
ncbi:MAG: hypothetical protein HQM15_10770 [Deltaproteobacteria bacterium]|nr:hypothetical protein [Deltaproteobacteria bacterium]